MPRTKSEEIEITTIYPQTPFNFNPKYFAFAFKAVLTKYVTVYPRWDSIKSVDQLGKNRHPGNIESTYPQTEKISPFI